MKLRNHLGTVMTVLSGKIEVSHGKEVAIQTDWGLLATSASPLQPPKINLLACPLMLINFLAAEAEFISCRVRLSFL